jgi:hypothetical protein
MKIHFPPNTDILNYGNDTIFAFDIFSAITVTLGRKFEYFEDFSAYLAI